MAVDDSLQLSVRLSTRELELTSGDSTLMSFSVAVGSDSHPTPTGTFAIRRIDWNPAWVPPNATWAQGKKPQAPGASRNPMRLVKLYFKEPDYYIHGTNDPESIGEAASHGCIRMTSGDAYIVARYLMEHRGAPRPEAWFWRVLHEHGETSTVYLSAPATLTITP